MKKPRKTLRMQTWILTAAFLMGVAACEVFALQTPSKTESGGQVAVQYISDAEYDIFETAKKESDPHKRAAKLFDFIQKYPNSPLVKQIPLADYTNIKVIEDEYAAYYAAKQLPDVEKRATALIEFHQKYPQSPLTQNVDYDYLEILQALSQAKKYELLESLSEQWLKSHPGSKDAYGFIAEAALNLKQYQKCGESLEFVYAAKPSSALAIQIHSCYQKADNLAKQTEWAEKLFQMPEFDSDYMLRYSYVMRFSKEGNLSKAAEYAQKTLQSAALVHPQEEATREQLQHVRRACLHILGTNLMKQGKVSEAISYFEQALKVERYEQGLYNIALCLDEQKEIDKALTYYAAVELMGGSEASKAKSRLELLYKAIHNDTLVGIEKVYQKGKDLLDEPNSPAG